MELHAIYHTHKFGILWNCLLCSILFFLYISSNISWYTALYTKAWIFLSFMCGLVGFQDYFDHIFFFYLLILENNPHMRCHFTAPLCHDMERKLNKAGIWKNWLTCILEFWLFFGICAQNSNGEKNRKLYWASTQTKNLTHIILFSIH